MAGQMNNIIQAHCGKDLEENMERVGSYFSGIRGELLKILDTMEEETLTKVKNHRIFAMFDEESIATLDKITNCSFDRLTKKDVQRLAKSIEEPSYDITQELFQWPSSQ